MSNIYLAGAHSRAQTMGHYLTYLDSSVKIIAYLYDNDEENPKEIDSVPVIKIDSSSELDKTCPVYIATRGENFEHISSTLKKCGMQHIFPVDVYLDIEIRNKYISKYFSSVGWKFRKLNDIEVNGDENVFKSCKDDVGLYVVSSIYDGELQSSYELKPYEKTIQVGTCLTDVRLEVDYYDHVGDNISYLNKQCCELAGMYWVWKNTSDSVVGLEHYRRHFLLDDDWLVKMETNQIDVILPVPLYVHPSIAENYYMRHIKHVWNVMMDILREDEQLYQSANEFFENNGCFSPCNMLIAKKNVFDKYCEWMFPIIFEVLDRVGELEDPYQNRYLGFLSERLMSFFFFYYDKYNVVYVDKIFLQ